MRYFRFSSLIIGLVLLGSVAHAQTAVPEMSTPLAPAPAPTVEAAQSKPIDPLFEALRRERDPEKARGIASQILTQLNDSGSATINLLMQWATKAIGEKRNGAALDFLDQATLLEPDYPEAWNRRATLHYTMGNSRKSMADINQVLMREPRHFGALAGMAGILTESGQDVLAMKAWEQYLAVYPADRDAQEAVTKLSEKLAGNRT
jgi:tetratricopeptide (TPR) repeat protein